ncbi:MAG TPA: RNA 3'-terminal phosphate cyclase [Xanthobacteraceae bacterium]
MSASIEKGPRDPDPAGVLVLDGSHGEGGGQILRTALSLSATTARAFHLVSIRAGRRNPGLLPQHLSAVRAAAAISAASVAGDRLGSSELSFAPSQPPKEGSYIFDVAEAAERGSAGSATLVLQTLVVPLALAHAASRLTVRGGTHVEWSPPFDHFVNAYLPALQHIGFRVDAMLERWGWYPVGGGEIVCTIAGRSPRDEGWPNPLHALERGVLRCIHGRSVAANLPAHIAQRMADRARASLCDLGVAVDIEPLRVTASCPGAGIFLIADYDPLAASFSAYGRLGRPAEAVADQAVGALREHHASGSAVELHLADQLLLPLSFASGPSQFTAPRPTGHLLTNAWTIRQFGAAAISIEPGAPCRVRVEPSARR